MNWVRQFVTRFVSLFRKRELDVELDDELRFHLEMATQENIRQGMTVAEAGRHARLRLGGIEQVKEEYREHRGLPFVESTLQDLRFAFRSLRKSPGLTLAILGTLTIGIGVAAATFSIIDAVLLHPLPYKEPDQLVMLWAINPEEGVTLERRRTSNSSISPPELYDWQARSGVFQNVVGLAGWDANYEHEEGLGDTLSGVQATPGLFQLLGVEPVLGRGFLPEEEKPGAEPVVVIQHQLWMRVFGGSPDVVGRSIRLDRQGALRTYRIVGVMPPGFLFFKRGVEIFTPMETRWLSFPRRARTMRVMGRLAPELTLAEAQVRADVFSESLAQEHPKLNQGWRAELVPLAEETGGEIRPAVLLLGGALLVVLLIMCTNVANLLLVRASSRWRQVAIQATLGARPLRLVRQFLVESLVLSLIGGAFGVALARPLVTWFRDLLPDGATWGRDLLQAEVLQVSDTVVLFGFAVSVVVGLVFALIPAAQIVRRPEEELLRDAGTGSLGGRRSKAVRKTLVISEVALAAVLVVCAGLLARSFLAVHDQGPGFRGENVLLLDVEMPDGQINAEVESLGLGGGDRDRFVQSANVSFQDRLRAELLAVPGVADVAKVNTQIMDGFYGTRPLWAEGRETTFQDSSFQAVWASVTDNYFDVLAIPIVRRRTFGPQDQPDGPRMAVVSQSVAETLWPNEDPVNHRFRFGGAKGPVFTVIGVCGDIREDGMDKPPVPFIYFGLRQSSTVFGSGYYLIRSTVDPWSIVLPVREAVHRADPRAVISREIRTMHSFASDSVWRINYSTALLGGLAGLSFLLAMIGVFGVLSYSVRERSREIGVRMAFGAKREQVLSLVVRQGLYLVWIGLVVGLAAALGVTHVLRSLLFGVEATDPLTFTVVAAAFTIVGFLASYFPARHATRVEPATVLRHD